MEAHHVEAGFCFCYLGGIEFGWDACDVVKDDFLFILFDDGSHLVTAVFHGDTYPAFGDGGAWLNDGFC